MFGFEVFLDISFTSLSCDSVVMLIIEFQRCGVLAESYLHSLYVVPTVDTGKG